MSLRLRTKASGCALSQPLVRARSFAHSPGELRDRKHAQYLTEQCVRLIRERMQQYWQGGQEQPPPPAAGRGWHVRGGEVAAGAPRARSPQQRRPSPRRRSPPQRGPSPPRLLPSGDGLGTPYNGHSKESASTPHRGPKHAGHMERPGMLAPASRSGPTTAPVQTTPPTAGPAQRAPPSAAADPATAPANPTPALPSQH